MRILFFLTLLHLLLSASLLHAQEGLLSTHYTCYDVLSYDLEIQLNAETERIAGTSRIDFRVVRPFSQMNIDLSSSLQVVRVQMNGRPVAFSRSLDTLVLTFPVRLPKGERFRIDINYGGKPGRDYVFGTDLFNKPLISLYHTGLRPSHWWPSKDHPSDAADSIRMSVIYPQELRVVTNGVLRASEDMPGGFRRWTYAFQGPVIPSQPIVQIGDYIRLGEKYRSSESQMDLQYYVLTYREQSAREYLRQVKPILSSLEKSFGSCPSGGQPFVWVEGTDQARQTGPTPTASFIAGADPRMVREIAAIWFGRSIRPAEARDQEVLDAFCAYAELLFIESLQGDKQQATRYLQQQTSPFYRGAGMLHSLRFALNNDIRWFETLAALTREYKNSTISRVDLVTFITLRLGEDYGRWVEQFLYHNRLPVLEYRIVQKGRKLTFAYHWDTDVESFQMPFDIVVNGVSERILPTSEWQSTTRKGLQEGDIQMTTAPGLYELRRVEK